MNTNKIKLSFTALLFLLFLPLQSSAYFTTEQTATKLNEETILFTVSYQFGFLGRELYMPIMTTRGNHNSQTPHLEYVIMNNNSTSTLGTVNSVVLTKDEDAQILDSQYYLPLRKSAEFKLVSLLTIPKEQQNEELDLSLLVTSLPFTMIDSDIKIPAQLNHSELQYYQTPQVEI